VIRRLLLLLVSLACAFALTSCGNGDDAKASSGPDIPAYAKTNDDRGAQKFAQYWIETLNEATTSGDTKKLKTLQTSPGSSTRSMAPAGTWRRRVSRSSRW
jgi:hypothetical protein